MRVEHITNDIVKLVFTNQREAASAMIRFQEYYESPVEEIRGKIFTLGYLKSLYSKRPRARAGAFTYIEGLTYTGDYNGFNIPSKVLKPFVQGLFDPLTLQEQEIVELFRYRTDTFYIIAVHEDHEDGEEYTLDHEIAHGLFTTDKTYREAVVKTLRPLMQTEHYKNLKEMLRDWGYVDNPFIMCDETHAYLGVDGDWLSEFKRDDLNKFSIPVDVIVEYSGRLKTIYEEAKIRHKI
jgi:hypothetical protein